MLLEEYKPGGAAIFVRLLSQAKGKMSKSFARHILTIGFSPDDQARMLDLAERNQMGSLTEAERREMFDYVEAGHLLALFHARAHRVLKTKPRISTGAGRG